jgi:WbqC-like protein
VLSQGEDVEAHALRRRGWSIAAIARHLNRDRRTIKAYLTGERTVGYRRQPVAAFVQFLDYCRLGLNDDPHLWSSVLFDEIVALGYLGGYSTFTRALRRHEVRPHCEPCHRSDGCDVAIIETVLCVSDTADSLAAVAEASTHAMIDALGWRGEVLHGSELPSGTGRSQRLADLSAVIGASRYVCGAGGMRYIEPELLHEQGIEVALFATPTDGGIWTGARKVSALRSLTVFGPDAVRELI